MQFNQRRNNNCYQQELTNATNDHHYLNLLINRYSSKNQLLANFNQEYQKLFQSYEVNLNGTIINNSDSVNSNLTSDNGVK